MHDIQWFLWMLLGWTAAGVLLAFFERLLYEAFWVRAGFLLFGFACVGAALFLVVAVYAVWRWDMSAAASALGFVISGLVLWYSEPYLSQVGDAAIFRYRFMARRAAYERIVAEVERTRAVSYCGEREGICFKVDAGAPVRVAFLLPGGILDDWEGVIYDPTGEVLKAQDRDQPCKLSAPAGVRELFGSDLVTCRHAGGRYYRCWFTKAPHLMLVYIRPPATGPVKGVEYRRRTGAGASLTRFR